MGLAVGLIAAATLVPTRGAIGALPVAWCLSCGPTWLSDAISNVALFVPLGLALAVSGARVWSASLIGAALSLGVELLQYAGMPVGRTPALADWITNSIGALLGASLVASRATLLWPRAGLARGLLATWTVVVGAVMVASSWLLSPASPSVGTTSPVKLSALPFTPGYGWYSALPDSGMVNGVSIPHGGTGPIIAQMARTDTVRLSVLVRGRDQRRGTVPIVYVHAPSERRAVVLLGQRGNSAVVRATMVARRFGLVSPELTLRDVFAVDSRAPLDRVHLEATMTSAVLSLTARERNHEAVRHAELALTASLGWTVIQGVIRVDAAVATLVTVLWLLTWFVPGGYWLSRPGMGWPRATVRALGWGGLIIGVTYFGAVRFGVGPLGGWEMVVAMVGAAAGALAGVERQRRYQGENRATAICQGQPFTYR